MKQLKIIIGHSKDNYGAYAENAAGIYGGGDTVEEAKNSVLEAIAFYKENNPANTPAILNGEYELVYKFDTQSFLNYYKGIFTNAALERITGINQKQLQHYATGLRNPRPLQAKKIETALHKLGAELMAVEL
jgi:predicted RNase H-like HicB family nuclease